MYVKIDEPKGIKELVAQLRKTIAQTKVTLSRIESLSHDESSRAMEWQSRFEQVTEKIDKINELLLEPEGL